MALIVVAHRVMARTSSISIAVRCDKCTKSGKNRSERNSIKKYFLALFNAATFVTRCPPKPGKITASPRGKKSH